MQQLDEFIAELTEDMPNPILIPVAKAVELLQLAYENLEFDDEYPTCGR